MTTTTGDGALMPPLITPPSDLKVWVQRLFASNIKLAKMTGTDAASELLAACLVAEDFITHYPNAPLGTRIAQRQQALAVLRAVIAKAEGTTGD